MNFGQTDKEKYESINEIKKFTTKVGKITRIYFTVVSIIVSIIFLSFLKYTDELSTKIILIMLIPLSIVVSWKMGMFMGQSYAWGGVYARYLIAKRKGLISSTVNIATNALIISYCTGGRRAAKTTLITMIVIAGIMTTIGYWVGVKYQVKTEKFIKKYEENLLST